MQFFAELFPTLRANARFLVFVHILRPLLRNQVDQISMDISALAETIVCIFRQHRIFDYAIICKYFEAIEKKCATSVNPQAMQVLEGIFTVVDAMPPQSPLSGILMALNTSSGKQIRRSTLHAYRQAALLESDPHFHGRDSDAEERCALLYKGIVLKDQEAHIFNSLKSAFNASPRNTWHQHIAVIRLVNILFSVLYSEVHSIGGEAVLRSLLENRHVVEKQFWDDTLFALLSPVPIDARDDIASALVALCTAFPLAKHLPKPKHDGPKRPVGRPPGSKSAKTLAKIATARAQGKPTVPGNVDERQRFRPQRQSALNVNLLTSHLYHEPSTEHLDPVASHVHSAQMQMIQSHGKLKLTKKVENGHQTTPIPQATEKPSANHALFIPHFEFIKKYTILRELLRLHAKIHGEIHGDAAKISLDDFFVSYGVL